MTKSTFYALSFTWGLPMNIIGSVVALAMILTGHKPHRWGHSVYFEIGENWGGCNFGMFFLIRKNADTYLKNHEYGHGIQNCYFGFLMPFLVTIPSIIRYWYHAYKESKGVHGLPDYYSIWFERQASELGCYQYLKETE